METDIILPPAQETVVPSRVSYHARTSRPFVGVTENRKIANWCRVYSGRSVIRAKFTDLKISAVNTERIEQLLKKGTDLGMVEAAEVIDPRSNSSDDEVHENSAEISEVVEKIMNDLPAELTECQRCDVFQLLHEYESIFSKGKYDIGRTPLVEYRIDTGSHQPIRQPLRRHPSVSSNQQQAHGLRISC